MTVNITSVEKKQFLTSKVQMESFSEKRAQAGVVYCQHTGDYSIIVGGTRGRQLQDASFGQVTESFKLLKSP
jgi:hypothetical protein